MASYLLVLAAALAVHAILLFTNPDLLPVWGDEWFTLATVVEPVSRILEILHRDIHPPLYYLTQHWWMKLPLGLSEPAQARMLSGLFSLAAVAAFDLLFLRRVSARVRIAALALLVLSPGLLLYARMARSYSLQMLAAVLTVAAAVRVKERPRDPRSLALAAGALAFALYAHYVPGLALLLGFVLFFGARREWRAAVWPAAAALAVYLPWLASAGSALGRWSTKQGLYQAAGGDVQEVVLKLSYWFFSATFGETPGLTGILAAAILGPILVWMAWRSRALVPWPWTFVVLAAVAGFIGTSRWVSFSFVPARMLWLLPFWMLGIAACTSRFRRAGPAVCCALLALNGISLWHYFNGTAFLNKGYTAPLAEISTYIASQSPAGAVAVFDTWSMDAHLLAARLPAKVRPVFLFRRNDAAKAIAAAENLPVVWYCRGGHDVSPGQIATRFERELTNTREASVTGWVPYDEVDRIGMRLLGWQERPKYVYRLVRVAGRQPR